MWGLRMLYLQIAVYQGGEKGTFMKYKGKCVYQSSGSQPAPLLRREDFNSQHSLASMQWRILGAEVQSGPG